MALAASLERYLIRNGVDFDVMVHAPTRSSMQTVQVAHVPGDRLAKTVILKDEIGYVMAVLPATHRLDLGLIRKMLGRELGLASELEFQSLFFDCEPGAIPPFGPVYGLEVIIDESLMEQPDIYFEGGDHRELVHITNEQFRRLLTSSLRGRFCHRHVIV